MQSGSQIMMTGVTIFIQLLLCYHAAGAVTDAEQRILNELAEKFLSSDSDFMEIKKNADFFPFVNAVELNRFVNSQFKATLTSLSGILPEPTTMLPISKSWGRFGI